MFGTDFRTSLMGLSVGSHSATVGITNSKGSATASLQFSVVSSGANSTTSTSSSTSTPPLSGPFGFDSKGRKVKDVILSKEKNIHGCVLANDESVIADCPSEFYYFDKDGNAYYADGKINPAIKLGPDGNLATPPKVTTTPPVTPPKNLTSLQSFVDLTREYMRSSNAFGNIENYLASIQQLKSFNSYKHEYPQGEKCKSNYDEIINNMNREIGNTLGFVQEVNTAKKSEEFLLVKSLEIFNIKIPTLIDQYKQLSSCKKVVTTTAPSKPGSTASSGGSKDFCATENKLEGVLLKNKNISVLSPALKSLHLYMNYGESYSFEIPMPDKAGLIGAFTIAETSLGKEAMKVFSLSTNKCETKQPLMGMIAGQNQMIDLCNGIGSALGMVRFQTVDKIGDPVPFGYCPVLKNTTYYFNTNNGGGVTGDGVLTGISDCLVGETCSFVYGFTSNYHYDDQGNLISN